MKPPCELIVKKFLPNIRAIIVKELVKNYEMKQIDVSNTLGITQASVSQYITSSRGDDNELLKKFPELNIYAKEYAKKVIDGRISSFNETMCEICTRVRNNPKFFEILNSKK